MAFLNKEVLQSVAESRCVETHQLLLDHDVPTSVRLSYLQGCVIAALEAEPDGKMSSSGRERVMRLGRSLKLTGEQVRECMTFVSDMVNPDEQGDLLQELSSVLGGEVYPCYFMADFEALIKANGANDSISEVVDCFGRSILGCSDWRAALETARRGECSGTSKCGEEGVPRSRSTSEEKVGGCRECCSQVRGEGALGGNFERVKLLIAKHLNRSPTKIRASTVVIEDLDGRETKRLVRRLANEFGVEIPDDEVPGLNTVEGVCATLGRHGIPMAIVYDVDDSV